ncbi:MAG: nucleotidyl transferase AbiEii/AbiGii toxin family protein [Lacibacter sp.]
MLQRKTVEPDTLSLIYSLQEKEYTQSFLLVGGTALALQLGHRTSTDIDFFTNVRFDVPDLLTSLQLDYSVEIRQQMRHALLTMINTVKTDFVFQPSDMIEQPFISEQVRMASLKEIAAMKIGAITARGKKRDFIDLYCLLDHFTLPEILDAFLTKYKNSTPELAIRSLFYFEDAETDIEPKCFFPYNWKNIKEKIKKEASKL